MDTTTRKVSEAWNLAQAAMKDGEDFYEALSAELQLQAGIRMSERDIKKAFGEWNQLSHMEAAEIASMHGANVRKRGFQAYLAHLHMHQGGRMARLLVVNPRSLAAKYLGVPQVKAPITFIKSARGTDLPPEIDRTVKDAVEDAIDDVESNVEGHNSKLIEVGGRGFKFGSGSDGGYGGETWTPLSHISGSGNWGGDDKVTAYLQAAEERAHTDGTKWWADKNKAFIEENNIPMDQLNYSDIYELDSAQAEDLDEFLRDSLEEEYVTYRLGAFYYGVDNAKEGRKGEHNMYVFGLISTEGRYLGNNSFTVYEKSFAFKDDRDMESKLQTALAQATSKLV
ncbi:hypothetical protein N9917_00430 [Deltaproteobacteria bacterium]|nr:hypothetical protein [Deltaproteobacteria bacterium]